jgi:hypothetical protein
MAELITLSLTIVSAKQDGAFKGRYKCGIIEKSKKALAVSDKSKMAKDKLENLTQEYAENGDKKGNIRLPGSTVD